MFRDRLELVFILTSWEVSHRLACLGSILRVSQHRCLSGVLLDSETRRPRQTLTGFGHRRSMSPRKPSPREWGHAAPKPTLAQLASVRERAQRASATFLKLDVETALTFTSMALTAENAVKRERNRKAARLAYETVVRLSKKIDLTDDEERVLNRGLKRLRAELTELGEAV